MNDKANVDATDPGLPAANFPKQAIVVIHGMGEQRPMDTIKGFVRTVWETDRRITAIKLPEPREVWSKPDLRTGSLELRRITTRQSIKSDAFGEGVRSDFYELYWADLSGGSTWDQVKSWIYMLLLRTPARVPADVFSAWLLLWAMALVAVLLAIATVLQTDATIFSWAPWKHIPLAWIAGIPKWVLALASAALGYLTHRFVVPYFGRVVRYTQAIPDNIAARKSIRERGLALLAQLHDREYERIVVVGHSLGSRLAYDLISYFWAARDRARTVVEKTPEFASLVRLEAAVAAVAAKPSDHASIDAFRSAQRELCKDLGARPPPKAKDEPDRRWLITDFVTLGCPLSHAEFLLASSKSDLAERMTNREFPRSPPLRELLDPNAIVKAGSAGFPLDKDQPKLLCFPFGAAGGWQIHHAAPFAAVRWTNIHDPAKLIFFGDVISGPVAPVFGPGVIDIDLRMLRGQSRRFTHTRYWALHDPESKPPVHVVQLRDALDLAGERLPK
jgi:pimeloyl-ACP methyl ester carboxylesterase